MIFTTFAIFAYGGYEFETVTCIAVAISFIAGFRLFTYKKGKIPFFMVDTAWRIYRVIYSGEDLDEKYKEMSINHATFFSIISIPLLVIGIIVEAIKCIL